MVKVVKNQFLEEFNQKYKMVKQINLECVDCLTLRFKKSLNLKI